MRRTVLALALLASGVAHAEPSLFGIELGSLIEQLPACEYRGVVRELCRGKSSSPGYVPIMFATGSMPRFADESGWVDVDDGKIVRVNVKTGGVSTQDAALVALTSKWGKPTRARRVPMQNAMGGRFNALEAVWKLPDGYQAELTGIVGGEIDAGSIVLSSPRALEIDRLRAVERAAKQRKP
jgi:hypothetical protein